MGSHAKASITRTRLSTLAVGTSLAAVGVGVVGAGAANAAVAPSNTTHSGVTPATTPAPSTSTASITAITASAATKVATMDLHGTTLGAGVTTAQIAVDWGDGVPLVWAAYTGVSQAPSYTYTLAGHYNVVLHIRDSPTSAGNVSAAKAIVADTAAAVPVAAISAQTTGNGGSLAVSANLTGTVVDFASEATQGKVATGTIDWGDNHTNPVTFDAMGKPTGVYTHTYSAAYSGPVKLSVNDGLGTYNSTPIVSSSAIAVPVAALAATAHITSISVDGLGIATTSLLGTKVDISAVNTTPIKATGTIDWGDGSTSPVTFASDGTASAPAHTYTLANTGSTKTAVVTVHDGLGTTAADTATTLGFPVNIPGIGAPAGTFTVTNGTAPLTAYADLSKVTFATGVVAAGAVYTVTWGDGSTTPYTNAQAMAGPVSHLYSSANTYQVSVSVTDNGTVSKTSIFGPYSVAVSAAPSKIQVDRYAGIDRYDTGLVISRHRWAASTDMSATANHATSVVIATGNSFPDALSGVPLAKKVNGPMLLTDGTQTMIDSRVLTEIQRVLGAGATTKDIYILGGTSAVSQSIQNQLAGYGYNVIRFGGADRFATSLQIAQDPRGMNNPTHVVVARGDQGSANNGFADALAAGPYAADVFGNGDSAVILSNNTALTPEVQTYVESKLAGGGVTVAAIGGQALTALNGLPGLTWGVNAAGEKGIDRFDTARLVAATFPASAPIGIATGLAFPDALTGGAYMASVGGPLILTAPTVESDATVIAVARVAKTTTSVSVFGGSNAVADAIGNTITGVVVGTYTKFTF